MENISNRAMIYFDFQFWRLTTLLIVKMNDFGREKFLFKKIQMNTQPP